MKRAVSISLGSSKRNKAVEIELMGERVSIERIGTDGDMEKAAQLFKELDGQVDAFGLGGTDLGLAIGETYYPLHSVKPMVRFVEKTPIVDGAGLKHTLERQVLPYFMERYGDHIRAKTAFVTSAMDRWGQAKSFLEGGFACRFGDLMFALGIPLAVKSEAALRVLAAVIMPIAGRLPFEVIYPTGEKQEVREPKYVRHYQWASIIAGDCHYVKRHIPDQMEGKVIFTNTTTAEDTDLFRSVGIKYLVTSTPVLEGRSFGTNMMEAALVAVYGKGRPLTREEMKELLVRLDFKPQIQELN
ncbi:MAG: hypothetical protein PVF83_15450 [Anaerolineales bacterium]|jgi:hypothetical protein